MLSAGIQYREAAVGRSREEEDQARIRAQGAPSWNSKEDVTYSISLYTLSFSLFLSMWIRNSHGLFVRWDLFVELVEIEFWRLFPLLISILYVQTFVYSSSLLILACDSDTLRKLDFWSQCSGSLSYCSVKLIINVSSIEPSQNAAWFFWFWISVV